MRPDAAVFHQHIREAEYLAGVDRGDWGIHGDSASLLTWPVVIFWVHALSKEGKPDRYYFRFELSGYPAVAPTACPWDSTTNLRLENAQWPKGPKLVTPTFNYGWNANALYAPCDRAAMVGHDGWRTQYPELWWQPTFKITIYLHFLYRLLHSSDYAKS
jgi:hypothetical protein